MYTKKIINWFWDAWCVLSLIGIWPRFVEPNLLSLNKIKINIPHLPLNLNGLTILQLSDLHWSSNFSASFKRKLIKKINRIDPDILVLTGDFLVRAKLEQPDGLLAFLSALKAKVGSFAVLGNHDYACYVTVNAKGDYDIEKKNPDAHILKGFKRLFSSISLSKKVSTKAKQTKTHTELIRLLEKSPFQLLHNKTVTLPINGSRLNICGLGEHTLGRCHPEQAFKHYDRKFPGIVLTHNPDSVPFLLDYPGDLILSGHTHGGQVNLPFIWNKFTCIENPQFKRGLKKLNGKYLYINRGVRGGVDFRWFSPPELTLFTLEVV